MKRPRSAAEAAKKNRLQSATREVGLLLAQLQQWPLYRADGAIDSRIQSIRVWLVRRSKSFN